MERKILAALEYLERDYLINASLIEPVKTGTAEVLYADEGCLFVKDKASDVYMMQTENLSLAGKLLKNTDASVFVAYNRALCDFAIEQFGFCDAVPCYQGVYRKEPFELPILKDFSVRLLGEDEVDGACELYHFDRESALKHIRLGLVLGGYDKDGLAATIGMHLQGSMGILSVRERARRRGYAEYLEKYLINELLRRGLVPYCHVVEGNMASLALQKKLGLELSETMLYWLHKER